MNDNSVLASRNQARIMPMITEMETWWKDMNDNSVLGSRNPARIMPMIMAVETWWKRHPDIDNLEKLCSSLSIGFYTEDDKIYELIAGESLPVPLFIEDQDVHVLLHDTLQSLDDTVMDDKDRNGYRPDSDNDHILESLDGIWYVWPYMYDLRFGQIIHNIIDGKVMDVSPEELRHPSAFVSAARNWHDHLCQQKISDRPDNVDTPMFSRL